MPSLEYHHERAIAALAQARRFYDATRRPKVDLDARIMHASAARMYAEIAVQEAHHARDPETEGPTDLQVEVSRVSDDCTRQTQQLAHDICRGALK